MASFPNSGSSRFGGGGGRFNSQKFSNDEHRINERIRVPQVRVIGENGEQLGVLPTQEAIRIARERGLDLMEVSPNSAPPVCKICDYGKFKYEKKKKDHEAKKKQTVIKVKEIQLRPQTEEHDLQYKFRNAKDFIEEGDKVKIIITYRGREMMYQEIGMKVLQRAIEELKDIAVVEAAPKMEGKKLFVILAPNPAAKKKPSHKPAPAPAKSESESEKA